MSVQEDSAVFDSIYDELFSDVYAYFNLCFDQWAAQDLSQEVFMRVWKAVQGANKPENWRAWVFRCVVNAKNDFLRKKYSAKNGAEKLALDFAPAQNDTYEQAAVRIAFSALSMDDREILAMKSYGFTGDEMGSVLGISPSAARSRLQKARKNFEIQLGEGGTAL